MDIRVVNSVGREFGSVSGTSLVGKKEDQNIIGDFGKYLNNALKQVSGLEKDAHTITEDFAAGKTDNIHQVMIAAEKSDIALQFTMQIRSKIMDAYDEIMRMQI
ncbi:flagellar hook-basal body complex protein FliE [Herbivorax sp. ANBcel31]|uniref:flagellar hook-basal body complex protein FliE n=1 Tax=Herbivorax sp. ANBcel31 TaxID=3069754 RepID=UPI0027B228AE|nr:flagellar hook-basal body complex protein FliE [Herbivorax sp. ANBcel31]MDQ2085898.1 flagellar hook-basal body complex protein FliE [Herbivorax sp. ANBcel31]